MKKHLFLLRVLVIVIFQFTITTANAQFITFTINGATQTYVTCINDSNDIGGYYEDGAGVHGFIYDGADTIFVNYPGATQTYVYGINNSMKVTGAYNTTGSLVDNEAFTYDVFFNSYVDISSGWIPSMDNTIGRDINDFDCIVGDYKQSTTHVCFSICGSSSSFHYNYNPTYINSLNNTGKRAGFWIDGSNRYGLIYDNGNWTQIDYPGATRTMFTAINDSDIAVGVFNLTHSFIYRNGIFKEIKRWNATDFQIRDINNKGFVAGYFKNASNLYEGFYMNIWDLGFRPDPDGWSFNNSDGNIWPQSWWNQFNYTFDPYLGGNAWFPKITYADGTIDTCGRLFFPDWPLFVRTFNENNCYTITGGVKILKQKAINKWKSLLNFWNGSCFGFTQSSFMVWDSIQRFKTAFPDVGPWDASNKLYLLPINDNNRLCINELMIKQYQKAFYRHINTDGNLTPVQTLGNLKKMILDKSKDEQGLGFLNQNGTGGHIVNPYKVMVDTLNSNFEWIYIYDNNCPGDSTRKVKVDKTLDSWYYSLAVNASDPPVQWGGNTANQGMFITWPCSYFYSQPIVDSVKKSVPFYEDAVKAADYLVIYNSTSSNIYIVNTTNDTIGFENNYIIGNMPDATPIVPFSGSSQIPIGYMIPSGQYNIKMSSFSNPLSNLTVYDNNSSYSYLRTNATIAQTDLFAFTTNGFKISNTDNITKQISIEAINDFNNEEKTFDLTNLGLAQNSNITFSILANDKLKIVNQGVASFYDVEIKYASSSGFGTFSYSPISIDANTTHIIATNWASIQSQDVAIYVDNGNDGTNEDTIYFNNLQTPQILTYPTFFSKSSASSADTIYIASTGGGTMNWTAASGNPSWLTITSGASGTGNDTIFISCSANSGAARTSQITINAAGASNSPYIIAVNQEGVMTAPANVVASDGNYSDGVHVSWDTLSGATHYMLYRSDNAGSDGSAITGWISVTSYIDTTALNGVFYYYSVKAAQDVSGLNATGFSTKDDGWRSCFTADFTYTGTCTSQPTLFEDNSAAHTTAYYLWDINNDGSTEYTSSSVSHTYTSPGIYTVNLTVTDSSLCLSTKQKSVTILSFPAITLPGDTTLCPDQSVTLDAGAGFNSYLWSTGATASSITVDSTGYGMGSYPFYVQVSNANGCSAIDTIVVTWSLCTEITEPVSNGFAMNIYPNPANSTVNIAVSGLSSNADMKIFNISGQLIFSESIENTASGWSRSYNFTGMPKGVYFVRLVSRDVVKVGKIIVY